jgi:hypothetical protein
VVAVSSDQRTLTIDADLDWSAPGPYTAELRGEDGTPTAPLACTRGSDDRTVVLDAPAPIAVYVGDARLRTHLALASSLSAPQAVLVRDVTADDEHHAALRCVLDDARVHAAPGPVPPET